jgi:tetratricopeptide (TPR) repeat protein
VDTLEVFWPGGRREAFTGIAPNQTIDLVEGEGIVRAEAGPLPGQAALAGAVPGALRASGAPRVEGGTASADRETVLRFWELYRSATRHRIEGRTGAAAADYEAALELDPEHENTLYWLGNMRFDLGDQPGAALAWERLLTINPRDARVHRQVGVIHTCVGGQLFDPQRAAAEFGRALEINQEETGSLLWLGQVALLRGRMAEAEEYLSTVLRSNPQSSEAHFLVGYIAWKSGRPEQAMASFATAVDMVRPYEGEESGLSEGDTESGRAMVADATHCETPASGAGQLLGLADSDPSEEVVAREMETRYRALDALLERARSGG